MKKGFSILFLVYYLLGSMILPIGDFSTIGDIPDMFRHCKATEDKDLTAFDFVTDHLINIDGLFDGHNHLDEQKPHKPFHSQFQHHIFQIVQKNKTHEFIVEHDFINNLKHSCFYSSNYSFQTISSIFHPPATV